MDQKGAIRSSTQGNNDYSTWVNGLQKQHLMLTERVFPVREFIETMLCNMNNKLSKVLRHGTILKNSGFHEDDTAAIAFGTSSSLILTSTPDYKPSNQEARDKLARIAAHGRSNASQIKAPSRRTAGLIVGLFVEQLLSFRVLRFQHRHCTT
ncbi:hypothetical protein JCM10908_003308 [Rhodotorula pacifica]|uniref:uncharacterized protein n=1 Tax=Rhodotorula pacifica TaxID=1495444 RepID=UPI003175B0FC